MLIQLPSDASCVWQAALKRLQLEYVDLVFCHRPDPFTPIEETVRAMNFVIEQGWAFYWGTSEWSGQQITEVIIKPQLLYYHVWYLASHGHQKPL